MGEIEPLRYRGIAAPCMPLPCLFSRSLQAGVTVVAAVVGIFNALVAPFALRLVRWSIAGPERAYV